MTAPDAERQPDPLASADAKLLSKILSVDENDDDWSAKELGHSLRQQLAAPRRFAPPPPAQPLAAMPVPPPAPPPAPAKAPTTKTGDAGAGPLNSFGDLLAHPRPPVELLRQTKEFAKSCRGDPASAMPAEVATVLYYASIAAALLRHGARITALDDQALRPGLEWAREQSWLDDVTRGLFDQLLTRLAPGWR